MSNLDEREAKRKSSLIVDLAGIMEPQKENPQDSMGVVVNKNPERRTHRTQIMIKPSTRDKADLKCKQLGISMNEAVNQLLEYWVQED